MQPSDDFSVEVHRSERAVVVAPSGEIDVATVDRVRTHLNDAPKVVLDLRGVGFMDTSGLQLVFETQRRATAEGFEFAIVRGSPQIDRLFEIAGFGSGLTIVDEPQQAM